eukprot:CAMPEP_0113585592 /NCGR_PEP_ID=MMETSP0015_2-20120614/33788_1 /TAXON_ID=2838 /ORGANISM="Odontella" /LENGTH=56 /DNA_ID=CAMNT_0000490857 /DNA_START=264 /DNA_END=430 /DNA_ORIENTATION=- /assembly_acc=CAM_ASM_000160
MQGLKRGVPLTSFKSSSSSMRKSSSASDCPEAPPALESSGSSDGENHRHRHRDDPT